MEPVKIAQKADAKFVEKEQDVENSQPQTEEDQSKILVVKVVAESAFKGHLSKQMEISLSKKPARNAMEVNASFVLAPIVRNAPRPLMEQIFAQGQTQF